MGLGDLGNAVIILLTFVILQFILTISGNIANIRRDWDKHKCNPAIMPFASLYGHDTTITFIECIKSSQVNFMQVFLEPIYASLYYFANNGATFTEMFERLKLFGNAEDSANGSFADSVNNRLYNLINATNDIYINIVDSFSKLSSSISILYYSIQSGLFIGRQSWYELPGTFVAFATGHGPRGENTALAEMEEAERSSSKQNRRYTQPAVTPPGCRN